MRLICGVVVASVALLISVQSTFAQPNDPRAVVDTYQRARAEGNVDAALALFADDAVVTVQGRESQSSFTGKDQVKVFLLTLGLDYQTIMQSVPRVENEAVLWTERDQGSRQSVDAQVQAIVQSARISSLRYMQGEPFGVPPKRAAVPQAPPPPPREIPSAAWAAGLAALGLLLLIVVFHRPRRQVPSRLDGQLLSSMQRARSPREDKRKAA
jgi:hypothetical protein